MLGLVITIKLFLHKPDTSYIKKHARLPVLQQGQTHGGGSLKVFGQEGHAPEEQEEGVREEIGRVQNSEQLMSVRLVNIVEFG